ncbi:MAG TPA: aspartyl protease family protein, partial [Pyrinomonadaceae bacterium]|nr:aspartyl protease family protein [Pyrinomonadaceae bacterium]
LASDDVQQIEEDTRQQIKQAEKLAKKGSVAEAEKLLRQILEREPSHSTAKLKLAYLLLKQKRLLEAYNLSFEVAKNEPKNSYAYAVLGATLLSAGNFKEANRILISAISLKRNEALAWAGLGMLDFYENRIFDSIENLKAAVYFDGEEPDYIFALAQVSARAEKYTEAAAAYNRFLQVSPQTDTERRDRIKGLVNFLRFLGAKRSLYDLNGGERTAVTFELMRDRPVITLKVNNDEEPLRFVLDTGSGISVISRETAERLKIKPITRGGLARAIGGDGKFEIVYGFLKSVSIGDVQIRSVPVYIRQFHSNDEKIDGYIGLSLISKFLTTIDYGNLTFSLVRKDVADEQNLVENKSLFLPLRLTSSGFLSGEVQLEGVEDSLNFIVDTGASISVISAEVANLSGISRFVRNQKMRVVGAAGVTEDVPSFLLPRITFGNNSRESITAIALDLDIINEASGFRQAGILGGNFLKNYRLTFDFKNSKVIFTPVKK